MEAAATAKIHGLPKTGYASGFSLFYILWDLIPDITLEIIGSFCRRASHFSIESGE